MKLAVISGGSRGLGEAICKKYQDLGYRVLEFSRTAPHSYSTQADFSEPRETTELLAEGFSKLSDLTFEEIVVVSNAGTVNPIGPTARKDPADVIASISINVTSAILFISEAIKRFQHHDCKKTIVNITSGAAVRAYFGWSLYCAAKAGMETYIRTLALEQDVEPHPFLAINIEPGIIDTKMQASIRAASDRDFPNRARFLEFQKSGALKPAHQIAEIVVKIVSKNTGNGLRYNVYDYIQ